MPASSRVAVGSMTGPRAIAIDCGTQSVRCLLVDVTTGAYTVGASEELPLIVVGPQQIEIDPMRLVGATIRVLRATLDLCRDELPVCIGLTNMRETAMVWSRSTGRPLHNGIMWMSQQSEPVVRRWAAEGLDPLIRERTGLTNHTFFFGSKIAWLLAERPELRALADAGDLAVGTVDSWLLAALTGGAVHATDVSNASRYQLMNLTSLDWDDELCAALDIPRPALPQIRSTSHHFGETDPGVTGARLPITGMIADQQASLLGHRCERPGEAKVTFGTSCVVSVNVGTSPTAAQGLVTSVAWADRDGKPVYEIEGSAFHCGYTLSWLSRMLSTPLTWDHDVTVSDLPVDRRVYVLPSFTELGAPRWPVGSGAVITGLGMDTEPPDLIRAGLESMAYQAFDLVSAVQAGVARPATLSVDGGGSGNDYLCQLLADLARADVVRPPGRELTAIGAARAALRTLDLDLPDDASARPDEFDRFTPGPSSDAIDGFRHWQDLIDRNLS